MPGVPHLVPYQGSKRLLAPRILALLGNRRFARFFEPFAGSAAMSLAAAESSVARGFVIGESLTALAALWKLCIEDPACLSDGYEALWNAQHTDPRAHFESTRDAFNRSGDPVALLYLLARCVKNAPRFATDGRFNQSADHRRHGRKPRTVRTAAHAIAELLQGRSVVHAADFRTTCEDATGDDLVYLDPPWIGTTVGRDKRYHAGLAEEPLIAFLDTMVERDIPFLLSYDGRTGDQRYGQPLPAALGLLHLEINAGRSSQATLSGRKAQTWESLYVSPGLADAALMAMNGLVGVQRAQRGDD